VRILHVIQELGYGGAERVAVSLAEGARQAGYDVAIASAGGALEETLDAERFRLPVLARRPWRLPAGAQAVRRAVRSFGPTVAHFHNPGMAAVGGLATLRGRRPAGLVTVHGVPEEDYAPAARVLRLAGLPVVACGPDVEQGLAARGTASVATIENAVGPAPPPAERTWIAEQLGIAPDTPLIVAAGRLTPQKNLGLAVRALAGVPDAALLVVGEGPLRDALAAEARAAGVAGRVVLAGARPDARALIGAAHALVLSSTWEGLPLVVLEALTAGTPLVATAVRGVRDLVRDGESALLVPPDDPEALAAALRRVLADRALAGRLAAGGRAVAAQHGEERMVAAYLDLYERLAGR
jgi:glycosyltransferase involved in cell wall biosynthesis